MIRFFNPRHAQLLYMDNDSAHFLVKHKKFEENVDLCLRSKFLELYNKHFESGDKISGIWVDLNFPIYPTITFLNPQIFLFLKLT